MARDGPRAAANHKTVFNGAADFSGLYLFSNGPTALAPRRRCSDGRRADGARLVLCPRVSRGGAVRLLIGVKSIICRQLTLWHWSRASVRFQGGEAQALRMHSPQSRIS